MAEKKSKIDLGKVVNESVSFLINDAADKEPDMTKKVPTWMDYATSQMGEEAAESAYEIVRGDPLVIEPLITKARTEHESNLVTEIRKDPQAIFKGISADNAISMAIGFIGDDNYRALKDAITNNGDVKTVFGSIYSNELWQDLVATATPEAVRGAATSHVARTERKEIADNLFDKEGRYSNSKAAKFLYEGASQMGAEEQGAFYREAGVTYTREKMTRSQE